MTDVDALETVTSTASLSLSLSLSLSPSLHTHLHLYPLSPLLSTLQVTQLPEKDELSWSKRQLLARMDVAMGGRVAEEIIFGADNITTGASSDLEHATHIATRMVTKFGMTESVSASVNKSST